MASDMADDEPPELMPCLTDSSSDSDDSSSCSAMERRQYQRLVANVVADGRREAMPGAWRSGQRRRYPGWRRPPRRRDAGHTSRTAITGTAPWKTNYLMGVMSELMAEEFLCWFGITKILFDMILARAREAGQWADSDTAADKRGSPNSLALKILSFFYILALGCGFRGPCDGSGLSERCIASFFCVFACWCVKTLFVRLRLGFTVTAR